MSTRDTDTATHDFAANLKPVEHGVLSRGRVRRRWGFDIDNSIVIENTDQLGQAIEQMGRMQRVLESFRRDILPRNPRNFAVFAEGPLAEIGKLQAEMEEYIARLEGAEAVK